MSRTKIEKIVKKRKSNERIEQKTDETSERQQKKLTEGVKKMKKSIRKIERRTRGRDTDEERVLFFCAGADEPETIPLSEFSKHFRQNNWGRSPIENTQRHSSDRR